MNLGKQRYVVQIFETKEMLWCLNLPFLNSLKSQKRNLFSSAMYHLCQKFPLGKRETKDSPRCQKGKKGISWGQYFQLFRLNSWTSDVQLHKHKPILPLMLASHLWRAHTWGRRGNIWFRILTDCYLKSVWNWNREYSQPYCLPTDALCILQIRKWI